MNALRAVANPRHGQPHEALWALTKVAVIESKLDGLDRLMMIELDELKYMLRGMDGRLPERTGRRVPVR